MNKQKRKEAPQRKQKRTEAAQTRRAARAEAVKKRRQARAERREQRRAARRNASGLKKLLRGLFRLALAGALVCLIAFLAVVIRGGSRILDLKYNDERIKAGLPSSATRPSESTTILSAAWTVRIRWAITSTGKPSTMATAESPRPRKVSFL